MPSVFYVARCVRDCTDRLSNGRMLVKSTAVGLVAASLWNLYGSLAIVLAAAAATTVLLNLRYTIAVIRTLPRDFRALGRLIEIKKRLEKFQVNNASIPSIFKENVQKHPDKMAFVCEGHSWTFREVDEYSNAVANYFSDSGYRKGEVVALFMESRPEFVCFWLGLSKIGVVSALINFNLRQDSLHHCIAVSEAKALIYGGELTQAIQEVRGKFEKGMQLFCSGEYSGEILGSSHLDPALQKSPKLPPPLKDKFQHNDKLFYIYTSGTTGLPKAAIITHERYLYMATGTHVVWSLREDDVIYCVLPIYHSAGGVVGVGQVIVHGASALIKKKFSASKFWDDCLEHNCTVIQYIGEICRYLLAQPIRPAENQHRVRTALGNGLRPQIWKTFRDRFNIPQIAEFYGSTEGNANLSNMDGRPGACGFTSILAPWAYHILIIRVDQSGNPIRDKRGLCIPCKPGEPGELVGKIKPKDPSRDFKGYLNKKSTDKKIIENVSAHGDAAFLTGDMMVMDEMGYIYFRDRSGDTFRWRGENVSTSEVEGTITRFLNLADVVVYGVEIPGLEGRAGMAAICDEGSGVNLDQLYGNLKKQLPTYARPIFLRITRCVDTTGTFKFKKTKLRDEGFDPNISDDQLYYFDSVEQKYNPINLQVYKRICDGKIRM